ncbi:MAG: SH3 domain-containing protein, partial [Bdellovibrionales bacterium]|nr:SH3 domain-containing protein [Bdellovibrionales bacterium]
EESTVQKATVKSWFLGVLLAILLLSVVALAALYFYLPEPPELETKLAVPRSEFELTAAAPSVEALSVKPRSLEPLLTPAQVSTRESISSVLDDLAQEDTVRVSPDISPPPASAPKELAVLNTEGPVEPEAVRKALEEPEPSKRRNSSVRSVLGAKDSSRNIFTEDQAPQQHSQPQSTRVQDTSEDFKPGIYRVSRNVPVRSRASYQTSVVASLLRGDRVYVESSYNGWLKIVSVRDRPGYIPEDSVDPGSWAQ